MMPVTSADPSYPASTRWLAGFTTLTALITWVIGAVLISPISYTRWRRLSVPRTGCGGFCTVAISAPKLSSNEGCATGPAPAPFAPVDGSTKAPVTRTLAAMPPMKRERFRTRDIDAHLVRVPDRATARLRGHGQEAG